MGIINQKEIEEEIIIDLMDTYEFSEEKAKKWVLLYGDNVVSDMWDAYSYYIESHVFDE